MSGVTTGVYIARDVDGVVLYVGSAGDVDLRLAQHSARTSWWGDVASVEQRPVENRTLAYHVERELIADLAPTRNQMSKGGAQRISRKPGPFIKPRADSLSRVIEAHGGLKQAAAAVGVDHQTMSNVWRGVVTPSSNLIARLIAVTGLAFDDLFSIEVVGEPDGWLASRPSRRANQKAAS
jgi:DNA-binding XRE family transcriptional regulator